MQAAAFLDLAHHKEFSPMGKRIQPGGAVKATTTKAVKEAKEEAAEGSSFGQRLASLRKAAGFTQIELAGVGAKRRLVKQDGDSRLRRRLLAIEKLDLADKRQVLQVIDAFIERGQLKRKVESRTA
jgi:hypothetical protein